MKKQVIKLGYIDFGSTFDPKQDWFYKLLSQKYQIELSDSPDYLIYGLFGMKHHTYNCVKIFHTGENMVPNFNCCDYALGFHYILFGDRYMRLPLWRLGLKPNAQKVIRPKLTNQAALQRKFCAMVVSNMKQTDGIREEFFEKLSRYKTVDSGGRYKNNVGGPVSDKKAFLQNYKFSLAFENTSSLGYCTEKLMDAFQAGTVPIYYGDPSVAQDFNAKAFINCHDYNSIEEVIEAIRRLDEDDEAYLAMLKEPIFPNDKIPEQYSTETILSFFDAIFRQPLSKAVRCDFTKPYADIDYLHIKKRDVYAVLIGYALREMKKIHHKITRFFPFRKK